jgi:hypothetical protein
MNEDIVLQVGVTEHLVNLLEGFQDVFIHISPFPDVDQVPNRSWNISLVHGRHQGEEVEIERGGAKGTDKGKREGFPLEPMNIPKEAEEAEEITQIPRGETHDPTPHLICECLRWNSNEVEEGGTLLENVYRVHFEVNTARPQGGNQILF